LIRYDPLPGLGGGMRRSSKASSKPAKARRRKAVTPKVARLTPELSEALDQQAATSEVLRIISSSSTDVQPVFDTIARSAARLCKAQFCYVFRFDGRLIHFAAQYGLAPKGAEAIRRVYPIVPGRASAAARSILSGTVEEIPDIHADHDYEHGHTAKIMAYRSIVAVPMLKDGRPIGAVAMARSQTGRFPGRQVELLKTFADQAVIAIENVRLFEAEQQRTRELSESLEQQTATSEVLKVISSSTAALEPVFQAILENATRICEAKYGNLYQYADGLVQTVASHSASAALAAERLRQPPFRPGPGTAVGRVIQTKAAVQIADVLADPGYPHDDPLRRAAAQAGVRTVLSVPMLKENELVGAITIVRQEIRPFTEKQIQLVTNFAAQAVIAIENTRLLNELRESLQQQTATADVLKVISRSTFDLRAVFATLIESAVRLCEARFGAIFRVDHDLLHLAAQHNFPESQLALLQSEYPMRLTRGHISSRAVLTGAPVQISDMLADQEYRGRASKEANFRSLLAVPLLRDGKAIGAIVIYRIEPGTFADKQLALLQTFADQAVIAIENVRLFEAEQQRTRELTESLEQQTATSEVLRVISSSPGDLEPVFEAMLQNSVRICEAGFGQMFLCEGDNVRPVATVGVPTALVEFDKQRGAFQPSPGGGLNQVMRTKQVVHIADLASEHPSHPGARLGGARSYIVVPMLREGELVGAIVIYRQEVRPFTDRQIALVTNFAAQAVIAVENARLLNELRQRTTDLTESLEQQTATSRVLEVISRAAFDLQAVFETVAESSVKLCGADRALIWRLDGELLRIVAAFNTPQELRDFIYQNPIRPGRDSASGRAALERRTVHIPDVLADPEITYAGKEALRTILAVPILKGDDLLGVLMTYHLEVRSFTDKQIALVETFADQAAIAIDNVRLLDELRESLDQQTATSEILRVISSSPTNVQPVFDSIAESAVRLCGGQFSFVTRLDGNVMNFASCFGLNAEGLDAFRSLFPLPASHDTVSGRAVLQRTIVEIADVEADAAYGGQSQHLARTANYRSIVGVPLLHEGNPIGAMAVARAHAGSFPERQIALLQAFADQAVIAIRNVRLFDEVQARTEDLTESLRQQTATADVLKVISRSTFDLQTVLSTLIESAARLCDADQGTISRQIEGKFYRSATYGYSSEFSTYLHEVPIDLDRGSVAGRALVEGRVIHIEDIKSDPEYTFSAGLDLGEFRTAIGVPMMREGVPIGVLSLTRKDVRLFTEKQIDLAMTFADQAAIAIENVRLFEAEQQRTEELAKSLEELRTAQDRLVQTQKLASLGQLTAGIAHEIKNPLNFVNNFSGVSVELIEELEEALEAATADERTRSETTELMATLRGNLEKIVQHGKRADSIVKNMLLHSREGSGEHRAVDINVVLEESLNLAYHGARAEKQGFNITLERSFDPAAGEVDLFPQEITRVFLNLISNGFYAATKRKNEIADGTYEPTLAAATKNLGDRVEVRIRDNGTGIPPEVKERMFNPFFTTKPAGEGTGLGLSISHDIIVKQHAGTIEVETQPGVFTEFRIVLPRTAALIAKTGGRA
jgi:GAF domain-containing protein